MKKVFLMALLLSLNNQIFANSNDAETGFFLLNKADELDALNDQLDTYSKKAKSPEATTEEKLNNICLFKKTAEKKISVLNEVTQIDEIKNSPKLIQAMTNDQKKLRITVKILNEICPKESSLVQLN